jgi:putative ABC transport system ATP-binding protein
MIKVKNLSKEFVSGDSKVKAVSDVNLELGEGSFSAIVGKSGSGKSTLLALLGALDRPSSGSIEIGDKDIAKLSDMHLISYRRNSIGFVFQNYNLIPNLSALENVMISLEFNGMSKMHQQERAAKLLDQVGISGDKQSRMPGRLSGGEQQRVSIARALANDPKIILADEPTGNLDSATGKVIIDLLKKLTKTKKTSVIVVTHDEGIAKQADKIFHMKDGRLS